jgi:hypothetical protein
MKKIAIGFILILILLSAAAFAWQATYDISWWSVDGGAESSSGGDFTLAGIIGQPDAGPVMTNGEYAVVGGYWHGGEAPALPDNDVFLPLLTR